MPCSSFSSTRAASFGYGRDREGKLVLGPGSTTEGQGVHGMVTTTLFIVLVTTIGCGVLLPVLMGLPNSSTVLATPRSSVSAYNRTNFSKFTKLCDLRTGKDRAVARSSLHSANSESTMLSAFTPHVKRRLEELRSRGVSERFLSLPDVPGLLLDFSDFQAGHGMREIDTQALIFTLITRPKRV